MQSALPSAEEYAALAPRPGSPVWRAFNDVRMLATSGYATLLQVAHPTVGYGVHQYSSFLKDPWGRLLRTLDYVHGTIYGGPEMAATIGRRVHDLHVDIKGELPNGERYHALEPEAFAWVHATLAVTIVEGRRHFARAMTAGERQEFLDEWLRVGRFVGVPEGDLPARWDDFQAYFDRVVADELCWTPAVPEVIDTLAKPMPPELPGLRPELWRVLRLPMSLQLRVSTLGLLPPALRERLRLRFTPGERRLFTLFCVGMRASEPLIRGPLANFGPNYVRWRREALERGEVASGTPVRREAAGAAA